jgi:hypothetical protein
VLSLSSAYSSGENDAYNPGVEDFGKYLKALRADLKVAPDEVAQTALGKGASGKARRSFTNYLLRIERGVPEAQNPKLDTLLLLAIGHRLTLPEFLRRILLLQSNAQPAQDRVPPAEQVDHASPASNPLAASTPPIDLSPFEAFGSALGKSLGQQLAGANRKRKTGTRSRKKPSGGSDDRRDARRRV